MTAGRTAKTGKLSADILIIGGGGAGLAAAVAAAEAGAKNIIVLEARHQPGGNAVFPGRHFCHRKPYPETRGD